jgi:hypothetical protein
MQSMVSGWTQYTNRITVDPQAGCVSHQQFNECVIFSVGGGPRLQFVHVKGLPPSFIDAQRAQQVRGNAREMKPPQTATLQRPPASSATHVHNTTRSQLLPLPSPLEQLERLTRHSMSLVLSAAAACPIFGRCPVRALRLQPHALLRMAPSQRLLEQLAALQLRCRRSQRLQLLCCGCPLSTVAFRLACANDGASFSVQRAAAALVMRRCLTGFAWRHWDLEVRDIAS